MQQEQQQHLLLLSVLARSEAGDVIGGQDIWRLRVMFWCNDAPTSRGTLREFQAYPAMVAGMMHNLTM
jgi:hypothetical protein